MAHPLDIFFPEAAGRIFCLGQIFIGTFCLGVLTHIPARFEHYVSAAAGQIHYGACSAQL